MISILKALFHLLKNISGRSECFGEQAIGGKKTAEIA